MFGRAVTIGRFSTVDEAIYPILFLLLKRLYITGQILSADGGWTAGEKK